MPDYIIFHAFLSLGIACAWYVLFYAFKRLNERSESLSNVLITSLEQQKPLDTAKELTDMVVNLHREVKTLETTVEQYQLQVVEMRDIVKRQTARWNMQRRRDAEEGEAEPIDDRTAAEQLQTELGLNQTQDYDEPQPVRRRRRSRTRRRPY